VSDADSAPKRSLLQLLSALPGLVSDLIRAEIDALKAELKERAIRAGIGIGLLLAAALFLLLAVMVGVFAAIAGIATALPLWASALIVFGGLLIIAIVLLLAGVAALKSSGSGTDRLGSIGEDLRTLRRTGRGTVPPTDGQEA